MNNNLLDVLVEILKQDERFISGDGELLKNTIREKAEKLDEGLIGLLLENEETRKVFFKDIKAVIVFDTKKFVQFVNNKEFLPDSYTSFKNKIGLTDASGDYISSSNEIVLSFPFKDCVLAGGQDKEDSKRQEIFYNDILGQDEIDRLLDDKVWTNFKRIDKDGEQKLEGFNKDKELNKKRGLAEDTITDNLIIKGNNLLDLHSLKKQFAGKIKLIYIDPPYNTGNDSFGYNDRFNHSTWLTFMKNRLEVARELLKDDGVIFVQCDDNEQAYLKVLMDEVFGNENFVSDIAVRSSTPSGLKTTHKEKTIIKQRDSIIFFTKKINYLRINPQYYRKEYWDSHYMYFFDRDNNEVLKLKDILLKKGLISKNQKLNNLNINDINFKEFYKKNKLNIFRTAPEMPEKIKKDSKLNPNKIIEYGNENQKQFAWNGNRMTFIDKAMKIVDGEEVLANLLCDFWGDIDFQNTQNEGGVSLKSGKKPEKLLQRIIELSTNPGDIVLDYHLGSGTTTAVAHKMQRQYIGIEQMDYIQDITVERMKKVIEGEQGGISKNIDWQGGGNFVYMETMESNQTFVNNIKSTEDKQELIKIYEQIKQTGFINYNINIKSIDENIQEFENLSIENMKKFLISLLDKNLLYVNYSEIEDETYNVSNEDKRLNDEFYNN